MLSWIENFKSLFVGIIVGCLVLVSSAFSQEVAEEQSSRVTTDEVPSVLGKFKLEDLEEFPKYLNGVSDKLFNTGLCLPSGSNLTNNQKKRIEEALINGLK